jgi:hypothetical protein
MSGKTNLGKALRENPVSTMAVVITEEAPMTVDLTAIACAGTIASIGVTENALTIEAAITGTTSIEGIAMNIAAIGVHGTNGIDTPEGTPTSTNTVVTTVIGLI